MPKRHVLSVAVLLVPFVACQREPASQVSPLEGEGEIEVAVVSKDRGAAPGRGSSGLRHAVESWAVVVDEGDAAAVEAFGFVTASGALDGPFGIRFDLSDEALIERAPLGRRESPRWVQAIVANEACGRFRRDGCLSVGGTLSEGIAFRVQRVDAELPIERIQVVDTARDALEGISIPFDGRLTGVRIRPRDPAFSRPVLLVRYQSGNRVMAGTLEPPYDRKNRPTILGEGSEAILEFVRRTFERLEMSRGAQRSFEREVRRELLGLESSSRLPRSEWQAYYFLSRDESGVALPIHVDPGAHAMRRVSLVRTLVEDARVVDLIH
jgi:hypothetical protein